MQIDASTPISAARRKAAWGVYGKVFVRLMPLLVAIFAIANLDRVNVSFAKLQMGRDLGFTDAAFGLGAGIFFVGYALFEVPANALLRKIGAQFSLALIMVSWGVLSALLAAVRTPEQYYLLRFALGAAEAGALPGLLYYMTGWIPSNLRGRAAGVLFSAVPISGLVAGPLSGWLMAGLDEALGWKGWQWLFVVEALPAVLLGLALPFVLPKGPHTARWLSLEERSGIRRDLDAEAQARSLTDHGFVAGLVNPRVWLLGAVDFALLLTTYVILFWFPTFVRQAGVADLAQIGMLAMIPNFAGMAGLAIIAVSSDLRGERRWHIVVPFLICAGALVAVSFMLHNLFAVVALFSLGLGMMTGVMPVFFALPPTFLKGPAAAAGFALIGSIASLAGLVSNTAMGGVIALTGSPAAALCATAVVLLIGAALVLTLPAHEVDR